MDLKTLSLLIQKRSLAYKCTVCDVYFGTETELYNHHKNSHSKRFRVSYNPKYESGIQLIEDTDYQSNASSVEEVEETSKINQKVKLEPEIQASNITSPPNDQTEVTPEAEKDLEVKQTTKEPEPLQKQVKTEKDDSNFNYETAKHKHHESLPRISPSEPTNISSNIRDTIQKGQYGYLSYAGFQPFTLEEMKKFAVQIVAIFKLESQGMNDFRRATSGLKLEELISVTQNDVTFLNGQIESQACSSQITSTVAESMTRSFEQFENGKYYEPRIEPQKKKTNLDDPNKFCYKCGLLGHFAWGCPNPMVPKLAPKRRGKRKRKRASSETKATTEATTYCLAP